MVEIGYIFGGPNIRLALKFRHLYGQKEERGLLNTFGNILERGRMGTFKKSKYQ